MIVYIKKGIDGELANPNFYAAYVDDTRMILGRYGIVAPELDYAEELTDYLGRKICKTTLSVIANHPENWGVFIKPVEDKKFTGVVVRGTKDLVGCGA